MATILSDLGHHRCCRGNELTEARERVVEQALVDELVGHVRGSRFLLSTRSADIAKPGGRRMGLHTDQWWMP